MRSSPRGGRGRYGFAVLLVLAVASPAQAQQKEPFAISGLHGFVELGVRWRDETRSSYGIEVPYADELKFEERLHLDLSGYVYLPRFLKYRLSGDLQLLQETEQGNNDVLTGGKWSLSFFEEHPYSLELFRDDRQTNVEQPFFRSYDEETSIYGATFHVRRGPIPTDVSFSHRSNTRSGTRNDLDEEADEFAVRARYNAGEAFRTNLDYTRTLEDKQGRDIFRQRLLVSNRSFLDAYKRKRFMGNLQFRQQDDDGRERTVTSGAGRLTWEHTPRLLTEYSAQFQRSDTDVQESNDLDLGASIRHLLYESLSSTLDVYARLQDASFGRTDRFGFTVMEEYTKRLGDWGRLDIDLTPYAELVRSRPTQTTAQVLGEAKVMPAALPVELSQRRIDTTTIVVTDASGTTIYLEGIDYLVFVQGDVTELTRMATGAIAPDEQVLVDYVYGLTGPSDLVSRGFKLDAGMAIQDWLLLYTQFRFDDEQLRSGDPDRELETRDRQVIGASVSRGWMSARVEFERDHSEFRAFTGVSEWVSLSIPNRSWWSASFVASNSFRSYDGAESVMRLASTLRFAGDVGRRGKLQAALDYQLEDWSGDENEGFRDLEGFGVRLSFDWRFRNTEISVGGSLSRIQRNGQEENGDRLFFRVKRNF